VVVLLPLPTVVLILVILFPIVLLPLIQISMLILTEPKVTVAKMAGWIM
jgi:hypothetical protein